MANTRLRGIIYDMLGPHSSTFHSHVGGLEIHKRVFENSDWVRPNTNGGFCMCGCGAETPIAKSNDYRRGALQGTPRQYLPGHNSRQGLPLNRYRIEDRGFKTPCWIHQGNPGHSGGYRQVNWNGQSVLAHRYFYESLVAPIPDGLVIDHLCRVRSCVNPEHLEPVTTAVNNRRGVMTKLTEREVKNIRRILEGDDTISSIARRFKVSRGTIRNIRDYKNWKEIP